MATAQNLEERFQAAVKKIQTLPSNGPIQPSNITKLTFYGLYKHVTVGPCTDPKPYAFNIVARAKWEAWDRCRTLSKEQAMESYLEEIRKILVTLPESDEVVAFSKEIDPETKKNEVSSPVINDQSVTSDAQDQQNISITDRHVPRLKRSSSSNSSVGSDEFFQDPAGHMSPNQFQMISNGTAQDLQAQQQASGYARGRRQPSRERFVRINENRYTDKNNQATQRAILTALTKLQDDLRDILERLNRLETSTYTLQQRELALAFSQTSTNHWFPLSGLRRQAIAFILIWPFLAFGLIRLLLRAKIIIQFGRRRRV